jgi:hypothetical protein
VKPVRRILANFAKIAVGLIVVAFLYFALPLPIKPSEAEVMKIEQWAAQQSCVGSLSKWSRSYFFLGHLSGSPNYDKIQFVFEDPEMPEPDGKPRVAGHHIPWRPSLLFASNWIDDRQQRYASGIYDRETGKITDWSCGCNFGHDEFTGLPTCPSGVA